MAYGAGRSKLYAAYGKEQATERKKREKDIRNAERAREVESERKTGLSFGLGAIGAAFGGPIGLVAGTALGKVLGGAGTYKGESVESYKIGTDVGQFGLSESADIAAMNRDLARADRADVWKDVVDVGKTAALAFTMGGGKLTDPSDFSWTRFGGKKAATEGMYGGGLFGNIQGGGPWTGFVQALKGKPDAGTLWGKWMGRDWNLPTIDVIGKRS